MVDANVAGAEESFATKITAGQIPDQYTVLANRGSLVVRVSGTSIEETTRMAGEALSQAKK